MRFSRFAILIVLSARLFGGCGLFLDLGNPSAASDPVAHGAFVTVRLFNCFGASREGSKAPFPRETAVVSGTAEGIVNGHRVSAPLRIVKLGTPGLSAVWWEQPREGVWVLSFLIADAGPYFIGGKLQTVLGALVAVRRSGVERRTHLLGIPPYPADIDTALLNLAASPIEICCERSRHQVTSPRTPESKGDSTGRGDVCWHCLIFGRKVLDYA
jgi:hypothetical protein